MVDVQYEVSERAIDLLTEELHDHRLGDGWTAKEQIHSNPRPSEGFLVSIPWMSMAWNDPEPEQQDIRKWVWRNRDILSGKEPARSVNDLQRGILEDGLVLPGPGYPVGPKAYAGIWRENRITWCDVNVVLPAVTPSGSLTKDLAAAVDAARASLQDSDRPVRMQALTYDTAENVARHMARTFGQRAAWDIANARAVPADNSW